MLWKLIRTLENNNNMEDYKIYIIVCCPYCETKILTRGVNNFDSDIKKEKVRKRVSKLKKV